MSIGAASGDSGTSAAADASHVFVVRFAPEEPPPDDRGAGSAGGADRVRVAVKDCIDVTGSVTGAGNATLSRTAPVATADAACLAGFRAAGASLVGKTNLHELCFGATGVNPHFGTPVNPLDPDRIPGGSSSGSAVAVARGWADVALGTDTAGSVRNPAACCGIVGLKTTWGRIPVVGTRPLAPSMDTIGPLARDVAGVAAGMGLLDPTWTPEELPTDRRLRIGRFAGVAATAEIDAAVTRALDGLCAMTGAELVEVALPGWAGADRDGRMLMYAEALAVNAELLASVGGVGNAEEVVGADVAERFRHAATITDAEVAAVRQRRGAWRAELDAALRSLDALVLPAYVEVPAPVGQHDPASNTAAVAVSFGGHPALALPIPTATGPRTVEGRPFPASLQLVGAWHAEERLVALGAAVEASAGWVRA